MKQWRRTLSALFEAVAILLILATYPLIFVEASTVPMMFCCGGVIIFLGLSNALISKKPFYYICAPLGGILLIVSTLCVLHYGEQYKPIFSFLALFGTIFGMMCLWHPVIQRFTAGLVEIFKGDW